MINSAVNENADIEDIGKSAAALSLTEIGLGSLLHSFKIPFTGHLLSLNQIAILSRSSFKLNSTRSALQISIIASLLKSLSPAGKKLTPMLAIAAQGMFYYLGLSFFGINFFGLLIATVTASLWAFIQPVLFIYLLFGKTSIDVAKHFLGEFEKLIPATDEILIWLILGLIILKCILAYCFSIIAIRMTDKNFEKYQARLLLEIKTKPAVKSRSHFIMALKDLLNPLFIFSFLLTAIFFIFSNSTTSQIIWGLLRPLAIGFILFYTIRVVPMENVSGYLHKKGFNQLGKILDIAIKAINK